MINKLLLINLMLVSACGSASERATLEQKARLRIIYGLVMQAPRSSYGSQSQVVSIDVEQVDLKFEEIVANLRAKLATGANREQMLSAVSAYGTRKF